MIVKIVKDDIEGGKRSLVKKKIPESKKKTSDFITSVNPEKFPYSF